MTKRIEINKPIRRDVFSFEYCSTIYRDFFIETEVVISEPKVCVPKTARAYYTDIYYWFNGEKSSIKTYSEITHENNGKAVPINKLRRILAAEIFYNCGDDGHVNYIHVGYVYVLESEMNSYPYSLMNKWGYELFHSKE